MRRLVVLCDGTWESAFYQAEAARLTNISRIANAILPLDERKCPAVPQVKLYLPGLGTGQELAMGIVEGALGDGLLEDVRHAYYFIAQNWSPSDEIFLFGFSRGAYIARLLLTLISIIGILSPRDNLHLFAEAVRLLCSHRDGLSSRAQRNQAELTELLETIGPSLQAQLSKTSARPLVTAMVLFDTVPLLHHLKRSPFGTENAALEPDTCQFVVQALSAYETRPAFRPVILRQHPKAQHQILTQVYFPGCHTDIGGGYPEHDLSDLTLHFVAGLLENKLSLDMSYLASISRSARAPWGGATTHVGGHLTNGHPRQLPVGAHASAPPTFETIHPSLLEQRPPSWPKELRPLLPALRSNRTNASSVGLWWTLTDWEIEMRRRWPVRRGERPSESGHDTWPENVRQPSDSSRHSDRLSTFKKYLEEKIAGAGDSFSLSRSR